MATKDACRETRRVLKFWIIWFLGFVPLTLAIRSSVSSHNLEIRNHLKNLNKPSVKSIKSPDGDVIDCVQINHQPAFDHPLLKNHTIQIKPVSYPEGVSRKPSSDEEPLTQLWQNNGRCPKGTIPIRRTSEEDLLRANSFKSYGKKSPQSIPNPFSSLANDNRHEHAVRYVEGGQQYCGAKAAINVWRPRVQEYSEFSLAQIWVLGGEFDADLNTIEAGWQVSSDLYGDNNTRLFTFWTMDSYKTTGCYNLLCSGFIQTSRDIALGATIFPLSSYASNQYQISLLLWKNPESGNWWLQFGDTYLIGYWPASLFTHLQGCGSMAEWGGEVVNAGAGGMHTKTAMGSGQFSEEGFGKAAFFKDLQIVDESNVLRSPSDLTTYLARSGCYDLADGKSDEWGEFFYFGGPGRNSNCP